MSTGPIMKRRTFLTGAGVALLLPRMESLGQVSEADAPRRLLTIVNHLSFYQPELIPQADGVFENAPPLLGELSDHFEHLKVFSGMDNPAVQNGFGHTPCVGILSGYFNKLHRRNRISIDQAVADLIGDETRFKSLVFQAGENLNFSQISWDKHGLPVKQIDSPRRIFNLLFQVDESDKTQQEILAEDRSILDAVLAQARSMETRLNVADRAKMDEYLTSVREVEKTVKRRAYWADRSKPQVNYELDDFDRQSVDDYVGTLLDLAVLALDTDSTRALTVQIPFWEGFKEPHLSGNYHDLSHHGQKPEKIEKLLMLEHAILRRISTALTTMKQRTAGNSSLFDQTTTLITASMGSANSHNFDDLPALVIDGRMKTAGHWRKQDVPMSNLYLGLLQLFGAEHDRFGESTGAFEVLS
ncbi:MAG: DUF1552 domain-containing protein [Planctomycetota bacterium]|nr:MAG: DUF1552 domain-containing protein [Planctomycetota bacterium]